MGGPLPPALKGGLEAEQVDDEEGTICFGSRTRSGGGGISGPPPAA